MSKARQSPVRSIAAHAILLTYTLIALFPVYVVVVNSFKNRKGIFASPSSFTRSPILPTADSDRSSWR